MANECPSCGADVLDIDVRCPQCGHRLTSTGAQRMLGSVVLAQYEIVDIVGQGGMAVVYRARHKLTEQEVALKILPPELAAHSQVKSRFLDEAKALAQLDHPNIVHLYNFGQEAGCFVLAMQYVQGATFERMILEAGRLPWQMSARICLDVLKALEYAHSRNIIHRDMKPSNVLVREADGTATVMDFGIAKMTTSTKLTATGQTMGTVRYMSPEQVRGQTVDARTDIYSLGATMYEAVVGDTPFDGETHFEIMTKHLSEPAPPPSAIGVPVPAAFERALMRSLAKRPEDRFQSAGEFRQELERSLDEDRLGEAETLRITRDVLSRIPKKQPTGSTKITGLAGKLEPTGVEDRITREDTDLVSGGRRRPWLWIGLGVLVLAGAAVVAVVMMGERGKPGAAPKDDGPVVGPPPGPPAPFEPPGVTWQVDEPFESDRLRVRAAMDKDADWVRAQVLAADERFREFLQGKGRTEKPTRGSWLTVELIERPVLCLESLYREMDQGKEQLNETGLALCKDARYYYRPTDKTLLIAVDEQLPRNLAAAVAEVMCLWAVPVIPGCDSLPGAFADQKP